MNPELAGAAFFQTMLSAIFAQVTASLIDSSGQTLFVAIAVSAGLAAGFGAVLYLIKTRV